MAPAAADRPARRRDGRGRRARPGLPRPHLWHDVDVLARAGFPIYDDKAQGMHILVPHATHFKPNRDFPAERYALGGRRVKRDCRLVH